MPPKSEIPHAVICRVWADSNYCECCRTPVVKPADRRCVAVYPNSQVKVSDMRRACPTCATDAGSIGLYQFAMQYGISIPGVSAAPLAAELKAAVPEPVCKELAALRTKYTKWAEPEPDTNAGHAEKLGAFIEHLLEKRSE